MDLELELELLKVNSVYINQEVSIILNLNNNNKLNTYKFTDLHNCNQVILYKLLDKISTGCIDFNKNYKLEYYYRLLEFIVDYYNYTTNNYNIENNIKSYLLKTLTYLNKGQYLLYKINNNIYNNLNINDIINYLLIAAKYGTFTIFMFWLNKTQYKCIEKLSNNIQLDIINSSIYNSDDRLYKYILNKILLVDKLFFQKNINIINHMINSLGSTFIPDKYILRRLKILSNYINLAEYFDIMLGSFTSSKILLDLHKYYYIYPYTLITLNNLISRIYLNYDFDIIIIKLNQYLKTDNEKILLIIILNLQYNYYKIIHNIDYESESFNKIIIDNKQLILNIILTIKYNIFINYLNIKIINKIFSIILNNNLFTKYLKELPYTIREYNYLLFTKFFYIDNTFTNNNYRYSIYIIKANLILHNLRIYIKRNIKIKKLSYNIKMYNILNDIKYFKPVKHIPVLKNGSYNYQIQNQQFINISPRCLLPNELYSYKKFILREKTDGILINNLPIGIFPFNNIIYNYEIKAEYIEHLDLYLIIDINIPNTTIIERYNILKNIHPHIKNNKYINQTNNINNFIETIINERNNINTFLNEYKNITIKWYPKFTEFFDFHNSINSDESDIAISYIIDNIILNNNLSNLNLYNFDGLILRPYDSLYEIKIKPINLISIDLLFDGINWVDDNNNIWNHIIINNNNNILKIKYIYKFYPIFNNNLKFQMKSYRYNKKNPYSYENINNIINILTYNWHHINI